MKRGLIRRQSPLFTHACAACLAPPRLSQEEPSYISYGEAYEINCARFGREADQPIIAFKKRLAAVAAQHNGVTDGSIPADLAVAQRLAAYQEVRGIGTARAGSGRCSAMRQPAAGGTLRALA